MAQLSSNFGENYVCVGPWYPSSYIDTENTMNGKAGGDFGQNLFHKHLVFPWAVTRSRTWMQYCYCCNVLTMTCLLLCMLALNILNLGKQNAQIFPTDYENGVKASEGYKRHCLQHVIVTYCVWNILTGRCLLLASSSQRTFARISQSRRSRSNQTTRPLWFLRWFPHFMFTYFV